MIAVISSLPVYISIPFVLIGYSTTCLGAGALFLKLFAGKLGAMAKFGPLTILATGFILGQGILASIWLFLALGGYFSIPVVASICLFLAAVGVYFGWGLRSGLTVQITSIWQGLRKDSWGWQSIVLLTLLLCLAWVTSIGRPFGGDATAFYMALPKVIAASQRLTPLPGYDDYTSIGLQGELHYSLLMMLNNPDAARLFAWPALLAGAVLLLAIGRQVGLGQRGQWITLAMIFTSTAVVNLSGDGKADLFAVPLGLAAYYWIFQLERGDNRLALWLTGLFFGFAIAAKFSYLPVMAPGLLLLFFWAFREDLLKNGRHKQILAPIFMAGIQIALGFLIALGPQLIKNTLMYQNPIAPFGEEGMGWAKQIWFGPETTRRIVLTYPFALTFGSYWGQYGNMSPLVLAFLPLGALLPRPRFMFASPLVVVSLAALLGLFVWILTQPSVLAPRYILAPLLLLLLFPARAAEYTSHHETQPRWLSAGIMATLTVALIAVGLYSLNHVFFPRNTVLYVTGKMNECNRDGMYCRAMSVINLHASPGDRVYMAAYYRYWLRPDLLQCASRTAESLRNVTGNSDEQRWLLLYQHGFRYLIADHVTHDPLLKALNLENPPTWAKANLLYEEAQLMIYKLDFDEPPASQLKTCRQNHPPAWDVVHR